MAPATGTMNRTLLRPLMAAAVCLILLLVPYTYAKTVPTVTLHVPRDVSRGFTVTKLHIQNECLDITTDSEELIPPFSLQPDGRLVIDRALADSDVRTVLLKPKRLTDCLKTTFSPVAAHLLQVEILDPSDVLTFPQDLYRGTISYGAPAGTNVAGLKDLVACKDFLCNSGTFSYSLIGEGSEDFVVDVLDNNGQAQVVLTTSQSLLKPLTSTYHLTLTARGPGGLRGQTNIWVDVEGIVGAPDVRPIMAKEEALKFGQGNEGHRQKRQTATVESKDYDVAETQTGTLFSVAETPAQPNWAYSLASPSNMFVVSPAGNVSLAVGASLDFDSKTPEERLIVLSINVTDTTTGTLVKTIRANIQLTNVNDEYPVFTNKPTPFQATLVLNASPSTRVYTLSASDADPGSVIVFSLSSNSAEFTLVPIAGNAVEIRTKTGAQFSVPNQVFSLGVTAEDTSAPQVQQTGTTVAITVGELPPQFMQQLYVYSLGEGNNENQKVSGANPIQAISFQSQSLTYSLQGADADKFEIGPVSGDVFVKSVVDYEQDQSFSFEAVAVEGNANALSSTVSVTINVLDRNEFPPFFTSSTYSTLVDETVPPGTTLLTVTVRDYDYNTKLTYATDPHFEVQPTTSDASTPTFEQTAVIKVLKRLDYDRRIPPLYDITVTVTDDGNIQMSGNTTVRVFLRNVNDEPPVFPADLDATLYIGAPPDTTVINARATDADQGDIISYSFQGGNILSPAGQFEINSQSGIITLRTSLPQPVQTQQYLLEVFAVDDGSCCSQTNVSPHTSSATVTINVLTDNLAAPEINCAAYRDVSVDEEQDDAFVVTVTATDTDDGVNGEITYSLLRRPDIGNQEPYPNPFVINSTTGEIRTAEKIDRENLLQFTSLPVTVVARDGGGKEARCSFLVVITDINDNSPVFDPPTYATTVLKSVNNDIQVFQVVASDADLGANKIINYTMVNQIPSGYFSVDLDTGVIKVQQSLGGLATDSTIVLTVRARDNGQPQSLFTDTTVTLTVIEDTQQQAPKWDENVSYTVTIPENTTVNSQLLELKATSYNILNDIITYSIKRNNDSANGNQLFRIGEGTTSTQFFLILNEPLNYEVQQEYPVTLRASDFRQQVTDQLVVVRVTDVNDELPYFLGVNDKGAIDTPVVLEGVAPPTYVTTIVAEDRDGTSPNNQIKSYSIKPEYNYEMFSINSNDGRLYTNATFDREALDLYIIIVEAEDDGQFRTNKKSVRVSISIGDVNDNTPQIPQAYNFSVNEDKLIGSSVGVVKAVDADSSSNLEYRILQVGANFPFAIQLRTGNIDVFQRLDYESGNILYTFIVEVSDGLHTNRTTVTVHVNDVNDNTPVIQPIPVFTDIPENFDPRTQPGGKSLLTTVSATDADGGTVNFYYSLRFTEDSDSRLFEIDVNSGSLYQLLPLDRDEPDGKAEYSFTVIVADDTTNPLFGYAVVRIRPIDINDLAPVFLEAGRIMQVTEGSKVGTQVGLVMAVDYDEGVNAEFNLTIISQTPSNPVTFEVRPNKYIVTTAELDRETIDQYVLELKAVDFGDPTQSSTGTITIQILDVNDNRPYFNVSEYRFTMSETQVDKPIGKLLAYDPDLNNALVYILQDDVKSHFKIPTDPKTQEGILTIYAGIDHDAGENLFNFTVHVTDGSENIATLNSTRVIVTVTGANDETPIFNPAIETVTFSEDTDPGTTLATFTATDADIEEDNGVFRYSVSPKTDPWKNVRIDPITGVVTLRNKLDRETVAVHVIDILAIDRGEPQLTGTATLSIIVTDINDNFPDFAQPYEFFVDEEFDYKNNKRGTIFAVDADVQPANPKYGFELDCSKSESIYCDYFTLVVNPNDDSGRGTADLYATGSFDREREAWIDVAIDMWDNRDNPAVSVRGTRHLMVEVRDKNDNEHTAASKTILVYNYKGNFGNIVIGEVPIGDPDIINDDKQYTLLFPDVAGKFVSVDPRTGQITLNNKVPEMSFTIKVRVTSTRAGPVTTSEATINNVYINEDLVYNSGGMRLAGITAEEFVRKVPNSEGKLESMYERLRLALAELLKTDVANVYILTVNQNADDLYIRYAAHGSPVYQASRSDGLVSLNKAALERDVLLGKGTIAMVPVDMCQFETCEAGCFNELQVDGDTALVVDTGTATFVGVNSSIVGQCGCRATDFTKPVGCEPGHCYHGGKCVQDDWGIVSCECPVGYDGPRCQQLRQNFNGTGFAMYKPLEQCEDSTTSIQIRTSQASGFILYNGPLKTKLEPTDPEDFILLDLVSGSPRLQINHGTGTLVLQVSNINLADGVYHTIDITRKQKRVTLTIDHCASSVVTNGVEDRSSCEAKGVTPGVNKFLNAVASLLIGGAGDNLPTELITHIPANKFIGCVKNLEHNAMLYDLSTEGAFKGAEDGCKSEDNLCEDGCGDHGQCQAVSATTGQCVCDPEYMTSSRGVCNALTPVVDLGTNSYIDWVLEQAFFSSLSPKQTGVSISYRTRDRDGILFHVTGQQSGTYITLQIKNNIVMLTYNLGDSFNSLEMSQTVPASDGAWHRVYLMRYGKQVILKMDSGEGRYHSETEGPTNGRVQLAVRQNQHYSGARLFYDTGNRFNIVDEDLTSSCLNDIRMEGSWFPMPEFPNIVSTAARVGNSAATAKGCERPDDCLNSNCVPPKICVPLWEAHECRCRDHFVEYQSTCRPMDYCESSPCFADATCVNKNPCGTRETCTESFDEDAQYFECLCPTGWRGNLCQCHDLLDTVAPTCERSPEPVVALSGGSIAGIIIAIIVVIIVVIVLIACYLMRRNKSSKPPLIDDDPDDDIRENVMYYDEEGAGEEDQHGYDLNRLRKPDDREHPSNWDVADIPRVDNKPLFNAERPDIGDFIGGRLNDADDDPNGEPEDTPIDFNFEGEGSIASSLSSLNSSSDADHDYNYLNDWGPKFAKLADMYNDNDDVESQ